MKRILNELKNVLFRALMRVFMPDLAKQMAQDGVFTADAPQATSIDEVDYIRVEDRGANVTIFAFSGLDVLFAGLARYEFQRVLHSLDIDANLVFVRDVHRKGFTVRPDGQPGGLDFFVKKIDEVKRQLGARHNVAVGSSIGGSAAFYVANKCGLEQAVIFGAAFTVDAFQERRVLLKTFFDLRQLVREPRAYFELIVVTLGAIYGRREIERTLGKGAVPNPLEVYRSLDKRPNVTLFYGATAWPDVRQAEMLGAFPEARLVPLPTGRHNTPAFLKQRGELTARLRDAIGRALPERLALTA